MHLDAQTLGDRNRSLATEWLLTDGAGGYASSTPLFCGTRRYHGLWVPALRPPVGRQVVFTHIEERLLSDFGETFLSTTEYDAGFYPDGTHHAESFDLDPLPRLTSRVDTLTVSREVLLLRGGAGVCVTYRVDGPGFWILDLAPFLAMRAMHALVHRHEAFRVEHLKNMYGFRYLAEGQPGVFLWTDVPWAPPADNPAAPPVPGQPQARLLEHKPSADPSVPVVEVTVNPTWYFNLLRRVERARGFDCFEDLLMPGRWRFMGVGPAEWHLFCSFDPPRPIDVTAERQAYAARQTDLVTRAGATQQPRLARLATAADAFIVGRRMGGEDLASVIAGYHWFGDWGRDALIALPGLAIETGRLDVAEKILRAFAAATCDGLVPNLFAEETGQAQFNTVDASLWFLQAVAAYLRAGGRAEFVREHLWRAACQITERYRAGTGFGIHADVDGLIAAGSPETQLTWMDAKVSGKPVTPRHGKPVEINALWVAGRALGRDVAAQLGVEAPAAVADLDRVRESFINLYWNEGKQCLFDCVFPDGWRDPAVRPNQILAVSLPHAPLTGDRAKAVVRTVREKLLTPRGLRTLAPGEPGYRGKYAGNPDQRDAAYHQGTAWPWLLGPYVDAVMAVEDPQCARGEASQILNGLLDAMEEQCLGQIGEIFDGDPPHRSGGTTAQAWSVAAAIHIWKRLEASGGVP